MFPSSHTRFLNHVIVHRQKALLFTLIRAFEFAPAVPEGAIGSTGRLQRPIILTEREKGDQMPLIVRLCSGGAGM
jgi:hypothetical protein